MNFVPVAPPRDSKEKLERYEKRLAELDRQAKALESKSDPASQKQFGQFRAELSKLRRAVAAAGCSRLLCRERGQARRRAASKTG